MKIFFALLTMITTLALHAQPVTGVWRGTLTQGSGMFARNGKLELKLVKKGDSLVGTSYFFMNAKNYIRHSVRGYFDAKENVIHWTDYKFLERKPAVPGNAQGSSAPMVSEADFNCPGGDLMKLDGKSSIGDEAHFDLHLVKLVKNQKTFFPDEWDNVIDGYFVGMADPTIIDSVWAIASVPKEAPAPPADIAKTTPPLVVEKTAAPTPAPPTQAIEKTASTPIKNDTPPVATTVKTEPPVQAAPPPADIAKTAPPVAVEKTAAPTPPPPTQAIEETASTSIKNNTPPIASTVKTEPTAQAAPPPANIPKAAQQDTLASRKHVEPVVAKVTTPVEKPVVKTDTTKLVGKTVTVGQPTVGKQNPPPTTAAKPTAPTTTVPKQADPAPVIAKATPPAQQPVTVPAAQKTPTPPQATTTTAKATMPVTKPVNTAPAPAPATKPDVVAATTPPQVKTTPAPVVIPPVAIPQKPDPVALEKFTTRRKIQQGEIPMVGDTMELQFFDNAEVDGDSIALFVNGKMMFNHVLLTTQAYVFKLPLKDLPDNSELVMVAENLGTIPPNTSYMLAIVNGERYSARLESTENSSGVIKLVRR